MIKLLIIGPTGSMGRLISRLALEDEEIKVVAACDINNIGNELALLLGIKSSNQIKIEDVNNLQEIIERTRPDVAIDFTIADATERNCIICVKSNIRCVIGTTALSRAFIEEFTLLVNEKKTPAVISSNMATGVNVFFEVAAQLAKYLADWDIEIVEAHHHRKVDSPSGTALTVGKAISEAIGVDIDSVAKYGRDKGPNKREIGARKEIGIHAIRAGDIVGDHLVLYAGNGERIELKHQVHSQNCLASGAITAVKFLAKAKDVKVYSMKEVLGL
ncbi:MAG: 4-hydroxy-tetrahydrodipicolinate reductase [Candidatus Lokiarchaeota archaeon]|nr:4-hydroxy-tetrahydrodipicolinate reductase [Candidatus Lokiarchaeota archaeon]